MRVWPLVGRVDELRFLDAVTRRADGLRGVVLAGAAGVGKSRLAREALAVAEQRGAVTRWAIATASSSRVPLGAFSGLLGPLGEDTTQVQVLRQAGERLLAAAGRAGVVVGVDDAHLLDELSARLVLQLVLQGVATLVITVRTGEPAPGAVTALWKDRYLDRVELQPLVESETRVLLEAVLGGPVDSAGAARMWALTRGNALFLRQLVEGELEAGRLHEVQGGWRWSWRPGVSPGLAELVTAQMGRLSEPVCEVVDLLALGELLGVTLLGKLTDPLAVEQAEASGLVTVELDGRRLQARLAHPLYGEVRRARIGTLRARRLRGVIATALASTGARRAGDTLRRAVLALESDLEPEPALLTVAARSAIRRLDVSLAERLTRSAVAAGGAAGGSDTQLILAYALWWLSRGAEADSEFAALAKTPGTERQRTMVAVPRAANLFWTLRRPAEAEAVLDDAGLTVTDEGARSVLTAARAAFHAFLGQPTSAVVSGTAALAAARLPDQAIVLATIGLLGGLGVLGRADEFGPVVSRAYLAVARSFDAAVLTFALCDVHMIGLRLAGYLHEVENIALTRYQKCADTPAPLYLMAVALMGCAALYRGHLRTAIRRLREARAGLAPSDNQGFAFRCLLSLTQALAMAGDTAEAGQALAELEDEQHPAFVFLEPELVLARGWVAAAQGSVGEAITLAHQAAEVAAGRGQLAHEVLALHTAVCFGDCTVASRLAELATRVDGPRAPAAAAQAAALAAADGEALQAVSAQLEQMGDLLAAADAAAQAAACTRRDRHGANQATAARVHRLAEGCEGARTPALAVATLPLLTTREREVATLVSQGLSDRQIADRLVLSIRTVEGHVYRARDKLGITRDQFADLFRHD